MGLDGNAEDLKHTHLTHTERGCNSAILPLCFKKRASSRSENKKSDYSRPKRPRLRGEAVSG